MTQVRPTNILSHWNHMLDGAEQSAMEFYGRIEEHLKPHNLKKVKVERIHLSEGGILSAKREYLQIRRGEHVFHICAAPFGNNFFLSWWLGSIETGLRAWIGSLPVIGPIFSRFIQPITYYKLDTAIMFQSLVHGATMEALDSLTKAKGLRALTENERKPIMRDFFGQLTG